MMRSWVLPVVLHFLQDLGQALQQNGELRGMVQQLQARARTMQEQGVSRIVAVDIEAAQRLTAEAA